MIPLKSPPVKREVVREGAGREGTGREGAERIERYSEAEVPTEYGDFRVVVYRETTDGRDGRPRVEEHVAIVKGDVRGDDVVVRVHSECMTGEILHSLKCDCREQLDRGLRTIESEGRGAVLYLRQEGRGIGLGDKIRAYKLQERGVDTVDANRMLGLPDDSRRYHVAAFMCRDLGIRSVSLLTNNPLKVQGLRAEGIRVGQRVPVYIEPNEHNVGYLLTKSRRMQHELEIDDAPENDDAIDQALGEDTKKVRLVRPDGTAE
jgi:GTP cyclohydrolase II